MNNCSICGSRSKLVENWVRENNDNYLVAYVACSKYLFFTCCKTRKFWNIPAWSDLAGRRAIEAWNKNELSE